MSEALCESPWCRLGEDGRLSPRQAAPTLRLCPPCAGRIGRDARRAAELWHAVALAIALPKRRVHGAGRGLAGGVSVPDEALEARDAVWATLGYLAGEIARQRGFQRPSLDVDELASYVERSAEWLAAHEHAGRFAKELRDVASDWRTWGLAYPARGDALFIGECPLETGDGQACGQRLYQRPDEPLIRCPRCGAEDTIEQWQRWMVGVSGGIVDAQAAAAHLSMRHKRAVTASDIRRWKSERKVRPVMREVDGEMRVARDGNRVLYQLADLVACAERLWGPAPTLRRRSRMSREIAHA